ncbi:MAG: hypothetical protein ACRYHA_34295 [Janthinobacterium lividum]
MDEEIRTIDGIDIVFRRKKRRLDAQHLIVVFSGFGATGEFTYDFAHALQDCPAEIVWIQDKFSGHAAYYLCRAGKFDIENAVLGLILELLDALRFTRRQCTLAGFSKGGSAALYFGLRHQFPNILATVPQFAIGSYIDGAWPAVADHMLGARSPERIALLDRLLPDALARDTQLQKNIYLLTSPADAQYAVEIVPNLHGFIKYANFNLFIAHSRLVRAHNQVTQHHVPLVLALLYSLASGAPPRYGYTDLIAEPARPRAPPRADAICQLRGARVTDGRLFVEGVAILRGLDCAKYSDIDSALLLDAPTGRHEVALAKTSRPALSREFYEEAFVNYDVGWFCTPGHLGLDMTAVPPGHYRLSLRIRCRGITRTAPLRARTLPAAEGRDGRDTLRVSCIRDEVFLTKTTVPPATANAP